MHTQAYQNIRLLIHEHKRMKANTYTRRLYMYSEAYQNICFLIHEYTSMKTKTYICKLLHALNGYKCVHFTGGQVAIMLIKPLLFHEKNLKKTSRYLKTFPRILKI
jgi:hypothetical protein